MVHIQGIEMRKNANLCLGVLAKCSAIKVLRPKVMKAVGSGGGKSFQQWASVFKKYIFN